MKGKGKAHGASKGRGSSMGNKGGAVRGQDRAAQVQARNAQRTVTGHVVKTENAAVRAMNTPRKHNKKL